MSGAILEAIDLGLLLPVHQSWIFRNVTLSLEPLVSLGIFGKSGAGKSLLLKTLATLVNPTEGGVVFRHKSVSAYQRTSLRRMIQYLPQQVSLLNASVEENLLLPWAFTAKKGSYFDRPKVIQMLKCLGLDEIFLRKNSFELSGGEQQAVSIVRALQLDPDVLLLDEATASMDSELTQLAHQLISEWQHRKKGAVIRVSHQLKLLNLISDSVVEFRAGSNLEQLRPSGD